MKTKVLTTKEGHKKIKEERIVFFEAFLCVKKQLLNVSKGLGGTVLP